MSYLGQKTWLLLISFGHKSLSSLEIEASFTEAESYMRGKHTHRYTHRLTHIHTYIHTNTYAHTNNKFLNKESKISLSQGRWYTSKIRT